MIKGNGISDIDRNKYDTVIIGEIEWLANNLNVSHFRNGDPIPEVKTPQEWERAGIEKRPACCYYNNDPANAEKYGRMYNWFAINDPRGLSPKDWHVPSDEEWTSLVDYLSTNDHENKEGIALRSTTFAQKDGGNKGGNNYGWNGIAGGQRSKKGSFSSEHENGFWWSSSPASNDDVNPLLYAFSEPGFEPDNAWYYSLNTLIDGVFRYRVDKADGFSVRCIKD